MIAIPWYFVHHLGKGSLLGVIFMTINLTSLFWTLYAGTLIDRFDRRHIFMGSAAIGGLVVCSMALLGFAQSEVPLWGAALVLATTILIYNIHYPTLYAFVQEVTSSSNYSKITSWLEIQGQMTNALAGGIAAILLTGSKSFISFKPWELHEIFLLDAITYLIAISFLYFIRYKRIADRTIEKGSVVVRLKSGFSWLRMHPKVMLFGTASYAVFVTIIVAGFFLLSIYVDIHLQADGHIYAYSDMLYALGSLFAGLAVVRLFRSFATVSAIAIMMVAAAGVFIFGTFNSNIALFFITWFILGSCNAGIRILRMTWLFKEVPNDVIGRTGSVFSCLNIICRVGLLSLFSIPFFSETEGVRWAFFILGAFILQAVLFLYVDQRRTSKFP